MGLPLTVWDATRVLGFDMLIIWVLDPSYLCTTADLIITLQDDAHHTVKGPTSNSKNRTKS